MNKLMFTALVLLRTILLLLILKELLLLSLVNDLMSLGLLVLCLVWKLLLCVLLVQVC